MSNHLQSKKIHLAIDGNEANAAARVGSNVYAYKLLTQLEQLTRERDDITCRILLADTPREDLPAARDGWRYCAVRPSPLWTRLGLPLHLWLHRDNYDLFYTPGHYGPMLSSVPFVSSVMDTAYLTHPEYFKLSDRLKLQWWTGQSVRRAQHIITISQHSKRSIQDLYQRRAEDISVVPPAPVSAEQQRFTQEEKDQTLERLRIEKPFLLHLGTIQPRKNIQRLIEAFEKISRRIASQEVVEEDKQNRTQLSDFAELQLILAGKPGWMTEGIQERIETSPFRDRIIQTGFIADESKEILLRETEAVLMVGLSEGFGIPAIEAINRNTLPIIADNSSLPEAVGPGGIPVDPLDTDSIADGMERTLLMTVREERELLGAGKEHIEQYSWEASGERLLEILEQQARLAQEQPR
jgi:glycosyltransferase involved in cell wall biosynthesis